MGKIQKVFSTQKTNKVFSKDSDDFVQISNLNEKIKLKTNKILFHETNITNNLKSNPFISEYGCSTNNLNLLNKKRSITLENSSPMINSSYDRIISKNGIANIDRINIKQFKFIADYFNTIIDWNWCYIITMLAIAFLSSWLLFAIFWYSSAFLYFTYYGIECVSGLEHNTAFYDYFLFSIETQQTIGYGTRAISSQCGFSSIVLILQCWTNIFLECFFSGILFAKLSRPKKRIETLVFSKFAVVSKRDKIYSFMCRVGDLRKSHIVMARVHLYLIRNRYTEEGEIIPYDIQELKVSNSRDCLLFMPFIIEHQITEASPLYSLIKLSNEENFEDGFEKTENFEILVTLEGTIDNSGATIQARSSYLNQEIFWNRIFEPLVDTTFINSKKVIDFSKFNNTLVAKRSNFDFRIKNNKCIKSNQNSNKKSYDMNLDYLHKNVIII